MHGAWARTAIRPRPLFLRRRARLFPASNGVAFGLAGTRRGQRPPIRRTILSNRSAIR